MVDTQLMYAGLRYQAYITRMAFRERYKIYLGTYSAGLRQSSVKQ